MQNFLSKLKDAFSKPIVFFFCVALPYLIAFILLAIFDCSVGLIISNIVYWILFFIHHSICKHNQKKNYSSEFYV